MTVNQAIKELIESPEFKEASRDSSTLRVYIGRIKTGEAKTAIKIELLERFGYSIDVKSPRKKIVVKKK
jgi:hypothetical protein